MSTSAPEAGPADAGDPSTGDDESSKGRRRGPRRRRHRGLPLRTLADFLLAGSFSAFVAAIVVVIIGFSTLLHARSLVVDNLDPSLVEIARLRAALLDQETGVRGFALSPSPPFLEPYQRGKTAEITALGRLESLLRDPAEHAVNTELQGLAAASSRWRADTAEPIIANPGGASDRSAAAVTSKSVFDDLRGRLDVIERQISAEQRSGQRRLDSATEALIAAVGAAIGLLAASGLATWLVLRNRVVYPVRDLVAVTDRVAEGEFDVTIEIQGPPELEQMAAAVDQMRLRLASALTVAEQARARLDAQAKDLARSNRDLEQFAYVASHDLQEPLRKVASFCQLLEQRYRDELDERGRTYIDFAVDGAKRMQALIADLLDFSRVGRSTERWVQVDMGAVAADAVAGLHSMIAEHHARIEIGDLPVVEGDRSLLGALVQNVVGNAIKYRGDAIPTIRLAVTAEPDAWHFVCEDNGIGIEPRFRERVFVIFQRLHGREAYEGTGIGLALCKKIVEFHGGRIWIQDVASGTTGTAVHWTLPIHQASGPQTASAESKDL